jgi:hypothetical protein
LIPRQNGAQKPAKESEAGIAFAQAFNNRLALLRETHGEYLLCHLVSGSNSSGSPRSRSSQFAKPDFLRIGMETGRQGTYRKNMEDFPNYH